MSITAKELLSVDLFKNAKIVAGIGGLNNDIKRINFTDCPLPNDNIKSLLVEKGDFFLNSFFIVMEDEEKMLEYFKYYVTMESSGTFIISEFVHTLPKKIIDFCNKHNFLTIFLDSDIPYATIIKTITELILMDQLDLINEMKIDNLLDKDISSESVTKTAKFLNKSFKKYYASIYINLISLHIDKRKFLFSNLRSNYDFNLITYKNSVIIIINFNKIKTFDSYITTIETTVKKYLLQFKLGVSNIFSEIDKFNLCIQQSFSASEISYILSTPIIHYKNLNTYKILYPIKDTDYVKEFYDETILPLIKYDKNNKSNLIKTIESYIQNDGDYKKTAFDLNQHENTIRYRITKAKKILNLEGSNFKFVEQLSIGIKIKNII